MNQRSVAEDLLYLSPMLAQLDEAPQVGAVPPLPLALLAKGLQERWKLSTLQLNIGPLQWREPESFGEGLGAELLSVRLTSPQLECPVWCLFGEQTYEEFTTAVLKSAPYAVALKGSEFRDSFLRFLCLSVVELLERLDYPQGLSWRFEAVAPPAKEEALSVDVELLIPKPLTARLIISRQALRALRQRFVVTNPLSLAPERAALLEVELQICCGEATLSPEEWGAVKTGDYIVLDRCGVDPKTGLGPVTLAVEGQTLVAGEMTTAGLKLKGNGNHVG